ncbi:MAG TPA: hypothetical protein VF605_11695 [Allosphingosinicella sp.]
MTYRIVKDRRAWWLVKWNSVTEEGQIVENSIELRFIIHTEDDFVLLIAEAAELPQKARQKIADVMAGEQDDENRKALERSVLSGFYTEFLQKIATDWRGVLMENDEPLKWEPANIPLLVNEPSVFNAAIDAYRVVRAGGKDIRSGN